MHHITRRDLLAWTSAGSTVSASYAPAVLAAGVGSSIPNLRLTTHEGKEVRLYDDLVKGKVVLINFMFTTCRDVCPLATRNLSRVADGLRDRLEKDVRIISVTVDPRKDTPAVLKAYAKRYQTPAGWYFLTGRLEDIDALRARLGVNYDGDDKNDHTGMVVYGNDRTGQWASTPAVTNAKTILWSVSGLLRDN